MSGRPCVFCEIVAGTREQEIVYADELVVAFLCEPPATWGHTLVVPRRHREDIWSIEADEVAAAMAVARSLAAVLRDDLGATGINLRQNSGADAGQDVSTSTCTSCRGTRTTRCSPAACGAHRRGNHRPAATPNAAGWQPRSAPASPPTATIPSGCPKQT